MKPICVKCHRFFRILKTGFYFVEGMPKDAKARPGLETPESWQPYKVWSGDKWECKGCGAVIIYGAGFRPIAEHYETDFKSWLDRATFQVNDC